MMQMYIDRLSQTSKDKGTALHKTPLISDSGCRLWGFQAICSSAQRATIAGVPTTSSGSIIGYDSENSGKHFTYNYCFIIKDINKDQQN